MYQDDTTTRTYSSRYGELTLVAVEPFRPISGVCGDALDDGHKFDMDVAEKIALITDNRRIQISFENEIVDDNLKFKRMADGRLKGYVVIHQSPSTCAFARIESIRYIGPDSPADEIAEIARPYLLGNCAEFFR